ncbi:hypothetical protein BDN70DRAFT_887136 [Pholiota conissans]|uniref:Uncharacterized protein n=1 Tax=Pholiota conissans TaxID=109636 RepID=A0A9P5YM38_9AGAR|nr:hypothetical protein BDN70DRAFT_887136 [Pholiota conissans]
MSNDYLSSLPGEMLDEISKFFQHGDASHPADVVDEPEKSYLALAQTCKSLRAHFQCRLFSNLYLPADTHIRKIAELIQDNPILASYIRMIGLQFGSMCGLFQYPPLLAIMHAASSFGTPPEIYLYIGSLPNFVDELGVNIPSNTMKHIFNAPPSILHAITSLYVEYIEQEIPATLFKLLPNLRILYGSRLVLSSNDRLAEDHTSQLFRPKLNALVLHSCSPATITMLCEQILDLSAVKELEATYIEIGNTTLNPNSRNFLARTILDCAQSVQKLRLDIQGMVGPFYNLSQLQHLRECTLDLDVKGGTNPVPQLCQLLHTLPPLPEHDLKYLHLTFKFIGTFLNENNIANSHVLFSVSTWSSFDAALVDVVSSETRSFKLTLNFYIPTRNSMVKSSLKRLFVNWGRKYLPKSFPQPNFNIVIHHSCS